MKINPIPQPLPIENVENAARANPALPATNNVLPAGENLAIYIF